MKIALLLIPLVVAPTQVYAAVYTTKNGTKYYTEPNGDQIYVKPSLIQTPPIEEKNEWCFFKLFDGRGNPMNPPAAWTKCSNLEKFVGN